MATFAALLIDGIAYGMMLFLISAGLTVTRQSRLDGRNGAQEKKGPVPAVPGLLLQDAPVRITSPGSLRTSRLTTCRRRRSD